jgi:hypothetical protein
MAVAAVAPTRSGFTSHTRCTLSLLPLEWLRGGEAELPLLCVSASSHVPTLPASRASGLARHYFWTSRVVVNHGKNAVILLKNPFEIVGEP